MKTCGECLYANILEETCVQWNAYLDESQIACAHFWPRDRLVKCEECRVEDCLLSDDVNSEKKKCPFWKWGMK